jgi:hypothetical protein
MVADIETLENHVQLVQLENGLIPVILKSHPDL